MEEGSRRLASRGEGCSAPDRRHERGITRGDPVEAEMRGTESRVLRRLDGEGGPRREISLPCSLRTPSTSTECVCVSSNLWLLLHTHVFRAKQSH